MKDPKIKQQIRRGYGEYKKEKTVPLGKFFSKIQAIFHDGFVTLEQ
jgi:hypothetical protein